MLLDYENLKTLFTKMGAGGLDISRPLKWGFFFMNKHKENLVIISDQLKGHGYIIEELHKTDDGTWVLQVSRVETLTAESLHKRNAEFNELADHNGVELYDGWDVGVSKKEAPG